MFLNDYNVSQSWNRSGRTGQDRTKSSSGRTKPDFCQFIRLNETGFLPDFCQFDVKNEPDGFYRIFLPDFCRIFASLTSKMNRPDFNRTGPDRMEKTRPVPTLT
jgi:hypothetical protein